MATIDYKLITRAEEIRAAVAALGAEPALGFDTETTGLDPLQSRLRLIQLATPQSSYVFDLFQLPAPALAPVLALLSAPRPLKVAHNAKFDAKFLSHHTATQLDGIFDTYLASLLVSAGSESDRHSLEAVANRHLNEQLDKAAQLSDWSGELSEGQLEYAARDAAVLLPLAEKLRGRMEEMDLLVAAALEFDCIMPIARMELAGVSLNAECWRAQVARVRESYRAAEAVLQSELGTTSPQLSLFGTEAPTPINLDSPAQVREALARLGIQVEDTREWRLHRLAREHPVVQHLLDYRGLSKALSSYGEGMLEYINPVTGRIHADFRQIGTPTGRITCSSPSLQQVPHSIEYRSCFRAPEGRRLVIADYSQIEMRILADFSRDPALLAAFESGADLHRATASQMLSIALDAVTPRQREQAKGLNYGIIYGMGAEGLAARLEISTVEAEGLIARYFAAYPRVDRWLREAAERAVETGLSRTASGRMWIFRLDPLDRQQLGQLKRVGKNAPIQGTASDLFKRALKLVDDALVTRDAAVINCIHDEIVVECDASLADQIAGLLAEKMVEAAKEFLPAVPVTVETAIADAWVKK
jgi:DNA polymerase I-like protein with 3'-5' exonuclease and polymerase domains